jgi:hypothetical protein
MLNLTSISRHTLFRSNRSFFNQQLNIHRCVINNSTPIMNKYKESDKIVEQYKKEIKNKPVKTHTYLYMYHCLPIKPIKDIKK